MFIFCRRDACVSRERRFITERFKVFLSLAYQVSMSAGPRFHFCGGALISSTWVVTSAACASFIEKPQIRLGEHNRAVNEGTEQL